MCDKCGLADMVKVGDTLECPICGFVITDFEDLAELNEHLNEDSYWNGEDDDPDGRLAEAQLKDLNDYWYASRGVR